MGIAAPKKQPFSKHLHELRSRLLWTFLFIGLFALIGYFLQDKIIQVLVLPLNQTLYYTSPTGGLELVLHISLLFGFVLAMPVIIYQFIMFLKPALPTMSEQRLCLFLITSWILMVLGISIAYFLSLPATLHFLSTFNAVEVKSLISTKEYFSFVIRYLGGFALLFQLPLILLIINQFVKLTAKKLVGYVRYVFVISFLVAAIITPTIDPLNQTIIALPIILLYIISIVLISLVNSRNHSRNILKVSA